VTGHQAKRREETQEIILPSLYDHVETEVARAHLLDWYTTNKRTLPWRDIKDPWATWVSEIMLQQTRVASVLEYFDRFMKRFPTPSALAEAEWDEVASLWAGLGYYSRAKNLWRGAKQVVSEHHGEVPSTKKDVMALSGVGPYTAGAILSIAFDQEEALVDGNVMRVLSRLYMIDLPIQSTEAKRLFWSLAAQWALGDRPGDLNQGLMELGATICTPKNPSCLLCPLNQICTVYHLGDPLKYPVKVKKQKKRVIEEFLAVIVTRTSTDGQSEYGLIQRPINGLLGGLWSLIMLKRTEGGTQVSHEEFQAWFMTMHLGESKGDILKIKHIFTHKEWLVWFKVMSMNDMASSITLPKEMHWKPLKTLDQLAIGGPSLKALILAEVPLIARRGSGR